MCPAENIQYWATYLFVPSGTITHPTLPSLPNIFQVLEIQVPSDQVYSRNGVVIARLTELGYLDATSQPLDISDIQDAQPTGTSSTICVEN